MRLLPLLACLVLLVPARAAEPRPCRVLFVGNSYTYTHDMPALLAEIARAKGREIDVDYRDTCLPGYTLERHAARAETLARLREREWTHVVLQEYGAPPPSFESSAETLARIARERGAEVLLFITPRSGHPQTRLAMNARQAPLTAKYMSVAWRLTAQVVPVGPTYVLVNALDENVILYAEDRIHPSEWGAYVSACTFYAALFRESPVGAQLSVFKRPSDGKTIDFSLPAGRQRALQERAWEMAKATEERQPRKDLGPIVRMPSTTVRSK